MEVREMKEFKLVLMLFVVIFAFGPLCILPVSADSVNGPSDKSQYGPAKHLKQTKTLRAKKLHARAHPSRVASKKISRVRKGSVPNWNAPAAYGSGQTAQPPAQQQYPVQATVPQNQPQVQVSYYYPPTYCWDVPASTWNTPATYGSGQMASPPVQQQYPTQGTVPQCQIQAPAQVCYNPYVSCWNAPATAGAPPAPPGDRPVRNFLQRILPPPPGTAAQKASTSQSSVCASPPLCWLWPGNWFGSCS